MEQYYYYHKHLFINSLNDEISSFSITKSIFQSNIFVNLKLLLIKIKINIFLIINEKQKSATVASLKNRQFKQTYLHLFVKIH